LADLPAGSNTIGALLDVSCAHGKRDAQSGTKEGQMCGWCAL
jgi:hypothetical protein